MSKIKWIIISIIAACFIGLGITVAIQSAKLKKRNEELSTAIINNKAYELENSTLKNKTIEFEYKVEQLNYSTDSLLQKLNETRRELKIKDKNLQALQYIQSVNTKSDTIYVKTKVTDTVFVKDVAIDTVIKDDWSKLELSLKYPNQIAAKYEFKNETTIVTSTVKETIDPPKKCKLARLFQKKHKVLVVDVIQENPYCENKQQRHIKIIK